MTPAERAAAPPAMPAEQIADAVLHMLTDENLAGRVLVCQRDQPRTVLLPTLDWFEFLQALSNLPPSSEHET